MVRVAIVEDEINYIEQLTGYLKDYQKEYGIELEISIFRDGDGILERYRSQYDIILMDIQMRFVDGMTAAKEIRSMDQEVVILFITNMTQYAIEGYKVDALDYILKPISYFAFIQRFHRAINNIRSKKSQYTIINIKGGILRLDVADIYYVESEGHALFYYTFAEKYEATGTLRDAEDELVPFGFSRANKGMLINLAHVDGIQDKCASVNGHMLPLSRAKSKEFMQELTHYWNGN